MKYHNYPSQSYGTAENNISINKIVDLTAVLNRTLNWENMPNDNQNLEEYQANEIGYFIRVLVVVIRLNLQIQI